ncbi:tail fiber protein [Bartonella sp. HY329]|uniref:phage tail protein n=1 Tax=unclassified Bartonella TaxID=2645622 RepID=UPI0021C8708D|nr:MULTISPECIES: phage tail protein [unclassified Bartonella]UXM95434.1 tail fiber protein [Bartonella sp. HY329]UXN09759.1 tail fiber protein [Bartonella sp. HY328]
MAVPYHTHNFELPAATKQEVVAGIAVDKVVVPASLGSAAVENVSAFATAAQGAKADSAVGPDRKIIAGDGLQGGGNFSEDRTLSLSEATLTALDNANNAASKFMILSPGRGLTGGGTLSDRSIEFSLNSTSLAAIAKAQTAVQPEDLGALAKKSKIAIADITATGTANSTSFLRGDGSWATVSATGSGSGDMAKSVYDPSGKNSDAFNMDNMVTGTTNRLFTANDKVALDDAASKAKTAVQPADLGALAKKSKIAIADITATGSANSSSFLRGDGSWATVSATGSGSGDMAKSVYDPSGKNSDAFNMDNMVAGTTNRLFTANDKVALDDAASKAKTAVQPADLGALAKKSKIAIADITATGSANSSSFLRGDGSWATVSATGSGSGDMAKSVYDPNNVAADIFDADNLNEGSRNLFLRTTERRAIAAVLASQNSFVGQIAFFAASQAPSGWLKANGALVSRISYPNLWAFVAENGALVEESDWQAGAQGCFSYGNGEASMFRLPDLRGEFLRSFDDGRGVDAGRVIGTAQGDAIRNITAKLSAAGGVPWSNPSGAFSLNNTGAYRNGGSTIVVTGPALTFDASNVVPTANENRPRNIALLACIRY